MGCRLPFLISPLLMAAVALPLLPENKSAGSRLSPTPQISGKFLVADGTRGRITLYYERNLRAETFVGSTQSTCMLPDGFKPGGAKPLDLTTIPLGTRMTVFYVRHAQGKQTANIVLAVRFDQVRSDSRLPVGVNIPCVKSATASASK